MKRDVVFTFWAETWDSSVQRQFMPSDRLALALFDHQRVGRLLIADPYRSGPTQFVRRLQGRRSHPLPARPATGLVSPLRLRRFDGFGAAALRRTYANYDRALQAAAMRLGLDKPAVITTNPFYAAFGGFEWAGPVTYYAWDDWAALPVLQARWKDLEDAYVTIRNRGHRVCAVSAPLLARVDPTGPGLVAPNGIEPAEWQPPWNPPAWLTAMPAPRILYVGAIHTRLNTDLVAEVSRRFPAGSIVVIGPVADQEVAARLRELPNVSVREPIPRSEIGSLTHSADVCIMPHHRNALTVSMSPLKIYEYCAAGRPSAVTDLPPVHGVDEKVVIVPDGGSFADGVERALALGPMTEAQRQAFLERNSWQRRFDEILDLALA